MSQSTTTEQLRPVCAGLLSADAYFSPIAYHPHPEATCAGAASGSNLRASNRCPIRTYASCHDVDGRFDGQFVTTPDELTAAACAMLGAVRGHIAVVMPVVLAKRLYGFVDRDFYGLDEWEDDDEDDVE
jgi:hypothetical protein